MDRIDFIETRDDVVENIKTLYSYLSVKEDDSTYQWAADRFKGGRIYVVEIINSNICFAPIRFVGYKDNTKEKHIENHGDGNQTKDPLKDFYQEVQDERLDQLFQEQLGQLGLSAGSKKYWIPSDLTIDDILKYNNYTFKTMDNENKKYWHIQMHLPEGKGGIEIDSKKMLLEQEPVIGTGEWKDVQCVNFKTIPNGSIVLVRKGSEAIALCEIIGDNFTDPQLESEYLNVNYRKVRILDWAKNYKQPRSALFSQGTFKSCRASTEQYKYIDGWLKFIKSNSFINRCAKLLKMKNNIILQGAPGTGKTYNTAAIALATLGVAGVDLSNHDAVMKEYEALQDSQIFFTTFHQSLDYEDFVEGLKPHVREDADGNSIGVTYEPEDGIFKRACYAAQNDDTKDIEECIDDFLQTIKGESNKKEIPTITGKSSLYVWWEKGNDTVMAKSTNSKSQTGNIPRLNIDKIKLQATGRGVENNRPQYADAFIEAVKKEYGTRKDRPVVLIIDEINRGNVSKVFGELITLLESDKREQGAHPIKVTLPYTKKPFGVPSNLYIIGTMNTTDRSTGTLDYALRRRFAFVTMQSDVSVVSDYYVKNGNEELKGIAVKLFNNIRNFIKSPLHLCGDFDVDDLMVGHSYFMAKGREELEFKMEYEVVPLINEYINDGILKVDAEEKKKAFDAWKELHTIVVKKEESDGYPEDNDQEDEDVDNEE